MLVDPCWPSSDLITISFSFKPTDFHGFCFKLAQLRYALVLRIQCLCKVIWELSALQVNSLCGSDRDVQDPEENAILDRKDMGVVSYKWTFLSLLDFCRCLCLLSNSFPIWESKNSLHGRDVSSVNCNPSQGIKILVCRIAMLWLSRLVGSLCYRCKFLKIWSP